MWSERRWLPIAGGASLLLNVFLIGLVAGHFLLADRRRGGPERSGPFIRAGRIRTLSSDERQMFTSAMATHRPSIRAARQAFRAQRAAVEADLIAPQFDRDKAAADLAALRVTSGRLLGELHAALLDAMGRLPPSARNVLVSSQRDESTTPAGR